MWNHDLLTLQPFLTDFKLLICHWGSIQRCFSIRSAASAIIVRQVAPRCRYLFDWLLGCCSSYCWSGQHCQLKGTHPIYILLARWMYASCRRNGSSLNNCYFPRISCDRYRLWNYSRGRTRDHNGCFGVSAALHSRRQRPEYFLPRQIIKNETTSALANNWSFNFPTAIATGFVVQIRFLGGALGLAIASNILNGRLAHHLQGLLAKNELHLLLENVELIKQLPDQLQDEVKNVFAGSYSTQLRVMIGFAAAQLPAILLLIKPGRQIAARKERPQSGLQ